MLLPVTEESRPSQCARCRLLQERSRLSMALARSCPCRPWTEERATCDLSGQVPSEVVKIVPETIWYHSAVPQLKVCRRTSSPHLVSCGDPDWSCPGLIWSSVRPFRTSMWWVRLARIDSHASFHGSSKCHVFFFAKKSCSVRPGRREMASYRLFEMSRLSRVSFLYPLLSRCKDNTSKDHYRSVNLYKEFAYRTKIE